jgi:N-carbamoylputrescine amidase
MAQVTVAALQLDLSSHDEAENIAAVSALVEQAAGKGAQIVLPPELFSGPSASPERTCSAATRPPSSSTGTTRTQTSPTTATTSAASASS